MKNKDEKITLCLAYLLGLTVLFLIIFVKCEQVPISATVIDKHIIANSKGSPTYVVVYKLTNGQLQKSHDMSSYYKYDIGNKCTYYINKQSWRFKKDKK